MNNQNINKNDMELFKIFHDDYGGQNIKSILKSDNYDITKDLLEGKNILFALGCNFNLKDYYPLVEKEYKKLGKNIKQSLNKLDNNGNSVLFYAISVITQINKNLKRKSQNLVSFTVNSR